LVTITNAWQRDAAASYHAMRPALAAPGTTMPKLVIRPTEITLHQKSRALEIAFDDGGRYRLECEFLRVYSPSAEVRGHGPGQEVLQLGKERVNIARIEPVGTYAVRLCFDDGHDTGLYSWEWLHHLAVNRERLWKEYLARLDQAGHKRKPVVVSE
jgi:DUF971 family protein